MESQLNLYAELTKRERHHYVCPMPFTTSSGKEIELPVVSLNGRELYEVKQKAEQETRNSYGKDIPKKDEVSDWEERLKDNHIWWTIVYSVRLPNDLNTKFFVDKNAMFDCNITSDQAAIIFDHYSTVQLNQPWLVNLDNDNPDKIDALINQLIADGKSPHFFLNSLTSLSANVLINSLASRLKKLMTENGLLTLPPEDGTIKG